MAKTIFVDPWDLSEEAAQSRYEKVVRKLKKAKLSLLKTANLQSAKRVK